MTIAEGSSMSMPSDAVVLAGMLATVLAAGRGAFPGWSGIGLWRWARGAVLVGTWTYAMLAGATLWLVVNGTSSGARLSEEDALLVRQIAMLGLPVSVGLGAIWFVSHAMTPPGGPSNGRVDSGPRWAAWVTVVTLVLTGAGLTVDLGMDPRAVLVTWLTMSAVYVVHEVFQARNVRKSKQRIRSRLLRAVARLRRRYGARLADRWLVGIGPDGQPQRIGRVLMVTDGQSAWLERDVARALAAWFHDQPLGATVASPIADVTFHDSWINDATLTLRRRDGGTETLEEERQRAMRGQVRGFPVGLIRTRRADLEGMGLRLTV